MSRREVLKIFKELHRAAQRAFDGDARTLEGARKKINKEFRKELNVDEKLEKKLKTAEDVILVLDKQVVQLIKNPETENLKLKLRKETHFSDNFMFQPDVELPPPRAKKCKPPDS